MISDDIVVLDVPYQHKDEVKALGARWNPDGQYWYVPAGIDPGPFGRWARPPAPTGGPTVRAQLIGQVKRCYRCNATGAALSGVRVPPPYSIDPSGFVGFEFVARALADLVNGSPLATEYRIGRIRMRCSKQRPEGYLANACANCDAMFGTYPLREALTEYLAGGGSLTNLVIGEIDVPLSVLPGVDGGWSGDDYESSPARGQPLPAPAPTTRRWRSGCPAVRPSTSPWIRHWRR